ncbi:PIN-like domain-containing protein [Sphingomonas sp. BAUL-RG-20F-R05-02]|uniref:PIN-like domain-containing protein n=1 Tax=Sphingomonas sp. BAUL-RG-20F-R05-02 TaxID=2914830 RepID=UPI001F56F216|nr:PIN-like domain-containing protein [Sphingomonas sp. BAUL-RG-20F-R05-02]
MADAESPRRAAGTPMTFLGAVARKLGLAKAPEPLLAIPIGGEDAEEFLARIAALLSAVGTHVYLDTSMLMWLTKVGDAARTQLFECLEARCSGRLHVPVWAGHEYLRHHVSKTVVTNLAETAEKLRKVGGLYSVLHPYLDVPLGDATPNANRVQARRALAQASALADLLGGWSAAYAANADAVIAFVNRHSTGGTNVFELVDSIEGVGAARFSGRLPPGFGDRNKKEKRPGPLATGVDGSDPVTDGSGADDDGSEPRMVGHNRWGDLIFWKEVLQHARLQRARSIVLLTNDRKNDWYLGGGTNAGMDAEMLATERLKPIPRPHPLLVAEARSVAGVRDLALLDSPYVGFLLARLLPDASDAFKDVAVVQRMGVPPPEGPAGAEGPVTPTIAPQWRDGPRVVYSKARLRDVLTRSRAPAEGEAAALVALAATALEGGEGLGAVLVEANLRERDDDALVVFAREVGDRSRAGGAGWTSAAADLCSALLVLPHKTSGNLYAGLLASAYLERADNEARLPPSSPALETLWSLEGVPHFSAAVAAVRAKLEKSERRPVRLPGEARTPLPAVIEIEADSEGPEELGQLRIAGQRVLEPTQFRKEWRLRELMGGEERVSGERIVRAACALLGIPFEEVVPTDDFGREFGLRPEIGLRDPAQVYTANREEES